MLKPRQSLSVCATPAASFSLVRYLSRATGPSLSNVSRFVGRPTQGYVTLGRLIRLWERATEGFCRRKIVPSKSIPMRIDRTSQQAPGCSGKSSWRSGAS
ncbi:hypothetical protein BT67DRAFT_445838 [Trichocladium antarcticum]|uniref:Uncharacterized protein n=1 Tax=Trichocladium antarcticum TaxID=1450529 RepID=A0AAN6UC13_9PEZI|nr:hypothetical protein BT67DRAFT_445838 [Trichocladium antarcticum]